MISLEHSKFLFVVSYQYWTIFFIWLLDTEVPAFKAFPSTVIGSQMIDLHSLERQGMARQAHVEVRIHAK